MAVPARLPALNASFDSFLFASIGEQENGMPLTVASALARLGRDPWAEAGRLAQMPRDAATEALATVIAAISPPRESPSEAPGIAARVVLLLPSAEASSSPDLRTGPADPPQAEPHGWPSKLALLLCLALLVAVSVGLFADRGLFPDQPPAAGAPPTP